MTRLQEENGYDARKEELGLTCFTYMKQTTNNRHKSKHETGVEARYSVVRTKERGNESTATRRARPPVRKKKKKTPQPASYNAP